MTESMTRPARAMQVWQVLISAAHQRRTMTYGQLGEYLGIDGGGVFAPILNLIMLYCQKNDLPPLTCLVVNKGTGLPGTGLTTLQDLPKDREAVYQFKWYERYPVQVADFEEIRE